MSAVRTYLENIIKDLSAENAKVPVSQMRVEANNIEGNLFAPDWIQYMIYGRGPGKQPPPDRMLSWVQKNPDVLAQLQQTYKYIKEEGAAYIVGRSIGEKGTRIWRGEVKGLDLLGSMEKNMPDLLEGIGEEEVLKIQTSLSKAI